MSPHAVLDRELTSPGRFPDDVPFDHVDRVADPTRISSLLDADLLDSPAEEVFDRAVGLAARLTGAPIALFSLIDIDRQFFKSQTGLDPDTPIDETPLSHSFCQYVVSQEEPLGVSDARKHPLLKTNKATTDMGVVAYLGVPVRGRRGQVIGSLCAIDNKPRAWSDDDLEALRSLVSFVEAEIALRKHVSERELLIEELNHRVRNLFSIMNGLIRQAKTENITIGEFSAQLQARIQNLSLTHHLIQPVSQREVDGDPDEQTEISLDLLLDTILHSFSGPKSSQVSRSGPFVYVGDQSSTYLALAIHEMATNALKYGALSSPEGRLSIRWLANEDDVHFTWSEEVPGMAVDDAPQEGFGTRLIRTSIEGQLGGKVTTTHAAGRLTHEVILPVAALKH